MNNYPWLPELILRLPDEAEDAYLDRVYRTFVADFLVNTLSFKGAPLRLRIYLAAGGLPPNGKEATFWHLTSEGETEVDRTPDFDRCERMGWVRAILERFQVLDRDIRIWTQYRNGKTNYGVSVATFEYVVFLGERKDPISQEPYFLPLTAYFVERLKRREKYEKEWRQSKFFP